MSLPRLRLRSLAWLRLPRRTARIRLTALYAGVFLVSGALLVSGTYVLFERATQFSQPNLPAIPQTPTFEGLQAPQLPQAITLLEQGQNQLTQLQSQLPAAVGPYAEIQTQLSEAQHQLAQAREQLVKAEHQVAQAGTLQAAQRTADLHQLLVDSGIALAIVALLALLVGWFVAGRILRPIRTITRKARRISSTSLHERLALDGPQDELKELGDTLDDLFGRLDAAFEAQRHFIANASHELRTPLTVERNLLQVALDDPHTSAVAWRSTAEELLASNDEQNHLIEALLALASSESGLDHQVRIDLAEICRTVISRSSTEVDRMGLEVDTDIRFAPLEGDLKLIERLVANLVDNAVDHNLVGGCLRISTGVIEGRAVLRVINSGLSISPSEIDRLFQPFQRLDARRTHHKEGLGLGLSIVKAIATTHHATIDARPQADGGLIIAVSFPPPTSPSTNSDGSSHDRPFAASHT